MIGEEFTWESADGRKTTYVVVDEWKADERAMSGEKGGGVMGERKTSQYFRNKRDQIAARDALVEAANVVAGMNDNTACTFNMASYRKAMADLCEKSEFYVKLTCRRALSGEKDYRGRPPSPHEIEVLKRLQAKHGRHPSESLIGEKGAE